jgi:ribosomal protein L44E
VVYAFVALILLSPGNLPAQSSAASTFDHFTTDFPLDGRHQFVACETCHSDGIFVGAPPTCVGCHANSSRIRATTQPPSHILTSERCESCHRTAGFVPVARVDHLEVFGTCASCHDGRKAAGKPPNHLPTSNTCEDCHRSVAWSPARFDHVGIVDNCVSCHNGQVAMGKPVNHIPASAICEDCHSTMTWSPVARVDHFQVIGTCSSCHNGVIAMGQHPQHVPTSAQCDSCHNTVAWR